MKERDLYAYVERLGGCIKTLRKGKHWVVTADFDGHSIWFTAPITPSDHHSMKNNEKWILRQIKEAKEKANG